jgi:hypothetical protein
VLCFRPGVPAPRRGLPADLVWGEGDGQILMHPDEAITAIFDRFAVCGSVRGTWLWLRDLWGAVQGHGGRLLDRAPLGPQERLVQLRRGGQRRGTGMPAAQRASRAWPVSECTARW